MKTKKVNGDQLATQADLATWGGRLAERIDELAAQMATKDDLRQMEERIARHFDVAAEKIHDDLAGANKDEISSLKDKDGKLDERVQVVEERLGIPTPPAT